MTRPDVLIVGAGAAGLAAAGRLTAAGCRVTLIEARDRIGGRIRTGRTADGLPIEAGPEFVHGETAELKSLLAAAHAVTEAMPDEHQRLVDGRPVRVDFEHLWEPILDQLRRESGPDRSFAAFLADRFPAQSTIERTPATDYVEGFNAADAEQIGIRWLTETEAALNEAGDLAIRRVTTGYDALIAQLLAEAGDVDLHLNARAEQIRWEPGRVEIDAVAAAGSRRFTGRAAIVTLPLGVLQAPAAHPAAVRFVPELVEKRESLAHLRMGAVVKAVFRCDGAWLAAQLPSAGFWHLPGASFLTWWRNTAGEVLTAWSGGPRAERLSQQGDDAIAATAVAELARALALEPQAVRERIRETHVFNWQRDPATLGAYSYAAVGGADASRQLAEPLADTLFFAGEATAEALAGTVTGAIRSGLRAADDLLRRVV